MINSSELKTILDDEIKLYNDLSNNDWTDDKNNGFKLGIKYCRDLIDILENSEKNEVEE